MFSLTVFSGLPRPKENNSYIFHFFPLQTYASSGHLAFRELRVKVRCLQRNEMICEARPTGSVWGVVEEGSGCENLYYDLLYLSSLRVPNDVISRKIFRSCMHTRTLKTFYMYTFLFFFLFFFRHNSLMLTRNLLSHTNTQTLKVYLVIQT